MDKSSSRIHLERSEFLVICGIVFLFAGLMFSLGVMVGTGLNPAPHEETSVADHEESEAGAHGKNKSGRHSSKNEAGSRKPSSEHGLSKNNAQKVKSESDIPGKKLRESFRKAKQADFEEMMAVESEVEAGPSSVLDSQAYFDSRDSKAVEDRNLPPDAQLSVSSEERKPAGVQKKQEAKKEVPPVVKTLFERKPGSANDYSPVYGEYTVLVASYATEDEAISKLGALRVSGFDDAYFLKEKSKSGDADWFRVGVGSFKDLKFALKTKDTLRKKGLSVTPIVRKVE